MPDEPESIPDDPGAPSNGAGRAPSRTFAALGHPGFRRYYLGQGISLIGSWLQAAAVRWIVFEQTGSEYRLGVLEVANLMPGVLVGLFAGALADRAAPIAMILWMQVFQMALAFVLAILVGAGAVHFWHMVLILALARISVTFEQPSRQVFFYDLVGPEILPNAIALNSGLFNATRVIGPAMAGLCLATLGATTCFSLNGLSFGAAIVAIATIRIPPRPARTVGGECMTREILGALTYLWADTRIRRHFVVLIFFGVVVMGYEAMTPAYAGRILGTGVAGYSILLASIGVGATLGALVTARLHPESRRDRPVLAGMHVFSLSLAAAAILPVWVGPGWSTGLRLAISGACLLGAGFGAALFYASMMTLIQLAAPKHLMGRVMGVWMIVFSGSVPLGAFWTGHAASIWGVVPVMLSSAVVCGVAGVVLEVSGVLSTPLETKPV